jgi:hypothetical protein
MLHCGGDAATMLLLLGLHVCMFNIQVALAARCWVYRRQAASAVHAHCTSLLVWLAGLQEVERLTAQLLQVRKDRALLQRQLEQFEQQQLEQEAADGGTPADSIEQQHLQLQQQQRHVLQQQPDAEVASLLAELEAAQEAARDQQHEVGV